VNGTAPSISTIGAALEWARRELAPGESGSLDAQVLLAHLLGRPRSWILAHPEAEFSENISVQYFALIRRAGAGEPLAYLTGSREFFGLDFFVSPDALIPRPETELLVETALQWLADRRKITTWPAKTVRAVDLGTGCGCIALTLAVHDPGLRVIATDISFRALAVAARNLGSHGVTDRVHLLQADLLAPLRGPVDLLCANLPYIPASTLDGLPAARYEPRIALDGGPDGLRLIARALARAARLVSAGGLALFEIEASQGEAAQKMARQFFPAASIAGKKDFAEKDRLLYIQT
jgi:release factor glutamine methyltransferase